MDYDPLRYSSRSVEGYRTAAEEKNLRRTLAGEQTTSSLHGDPRAGHLDWLQWQYRKHTESQWLKEKQKENAGGNAHLQSDHPVVDADKLGGPKKKFNVTYGSWVSQKLEETRQMQQERKEAEQEDAARCLPITFRIHKALTGSFDCKEARNKAAQRS